MEAAKNLNRRVRTTEQASVKERQRRQRMTSTPLGAELFDKEKVSDGSVGHVSKPGEVEATLTVNGESYMVKISAATLEYLLEGYIKVEPDGIRTEKRRLVKNRLKGRIRQNTYVDVGGAFWSGNDETTSKGKEGQGQDGTTNHEPRGRQGHAPRFIHSQCPGENEERKPEIVQRNEEHIFLPNGTEEAGAELSAMPLPQITEAATWAQDESSIMPLQHHVEAAEVVNESSRSHHELSPAPLEPLDETVNDSFGSQNALSTLP